MLLLFLKPVSNSMYTLSTIETWSIDVYFIYDFNRTLCLNVVSICFMHFFLIKYVVSGVPKKMIEGAKLPLLYMTKYFDLFFPLFLSFCTSFSSSFESFYSFFIQYIARWSNFPWKNVKFAPPPLVCLGLTILVFPIQRLLTMGEQRSRPKNCWIFIL